MIDEVAGANGGGREAEGAEDLEPLEEALGYRFSDRVLLETALCHSSYAHETEGVSSNERLEFLGDAVIGNVVAHLLFEAHPRWKEGDLTRALHRLVDKRALSELARKIDIGPYLRLGRTERRSAGETKTTILADAMEALIGAMYLDGGMEAVVALAFRAFPEALAANAPRVGRDPKTAFQERVMAETGEFPRYCILEDSGIEGDDERFHVEVRVQGEAWGAGQGRTKRSAERAAAERAMQRAEASDAADE